MHLENLVPRYLQTGRVPGPKIEAFEGAKFADAGVGSAGPRFTILHV